MLGVALLLLPTLASASLLPSGLPGMTGRPWLAWRTETVDENFLSVKAVGLRLDSQDNPHLAFSRTGTTGWISPWYAKGTGPTIWEKSEIEPKGVAGGLALDSSNRPHVAYRSFLRELGKMDAKYAYLNGTTWVTETIQAITDPGTVDTIRIAVDANSSPHVTYARSNQGLKYAYRNASGWQIESVYDQAGAGYWHSLGLDSQGRPHVAFWADPDLKYASRNEVIVDGVPTITWETQTVLFGCGTDVSLAIDQDDHPHIACHGATATSEEGLRYFYHSGTGWSTELADPGSRRGYSTSIDIDATGKPHISYQYYPGAPNDPLEPGQLHYTTKTSAGWSIETVDRIGQSNGDASSIDLDSQGRPHIGYVLQHWFSGPSEPLNRLFDLLYAAPASSALTAVGN